MKIKIAAVVITALFITCSKENSPEQELISSGNVLLAKVDTAGDIPLNDLGTGPFRGYVGGLYPGGTNIASDTYALDLHRACKLMVPLDTFGNPSPTGKIVFIS